MFAGAREVRVRFPIAKRVRRLIALAGAVGVAVAASGCMGAGADVTLLGYTTPREVYERMIPDFQATAPGRDIGFQKSFGPSGDQSRAAEAGLDADVLALSLAPDLTRLIDDGLVSPTWDDGPTHGFVSESVVVFAVREGNPKNIRTWDDLVRDDIEVITPNPSPRAGAVEHRRGLRGAAQAGPHQGRGAALPGRAVPPRARAAQGRPRVAADLPRRQGRCPFGVRERGHHGPAEGREHRLRHPRSDGADPEPHRGQHRGGRPGGRAGVRALRHQRPARRSSPRRATARVLPEVARRHAAEYPVPPGLFTVDGTLGGGTASAPTFLPPAPVT